MKGRDLVVDRKGRRAGPRSTAFGGAEVDRKLAAHVVDGGRLRATLLELWQRTRMDWGFVTDRLSQTFRRETWIGAHERRFLGESLFGLIRHLRRVDAALARGRRVHKQPRDLERLIALFVLEDLVDPARAAQVERDLDWNAVASIDEVIRAERRTVARIALAASLPDWLASRLVADWGDDAEPLAMALNERAPMTVRANLLVTSRDALAAELATAGLETTPGRWSSTALHIESRTNLFATDAFKRGAMEAQDEGSQMLADFAARGLAGRPLIVDLCAGAGGKTLAIAARTGNHGRIIASDVDRGKLEELRRRARRAQVSNARAIHLPDGVWPQAVHELRGKADLVFVDAPCSGIGALRRNPEARWRLRESDLATFATRQREILEGATALCAPGGRVVYATCTLLRVENQDVVEPLVAAHPELTGGDEMLVAPHSHGTDGFYARELRRGHL